MSAAERSGIQSHLTIAFPIKTPADAKALAEELPPLMADFAKAQDGIGSVHYSRFLPVDDKTLIFIADIDGEVETLSENLAKSAGPVFDAIFKHVANPPPTPVDSNSDAFTKWVKNHNHRALAPYTAFEDASVQDIKACARAAGFTGNTRQSPLLLYAPAKSGLRAFVLEEAVLTAMKSGVKKGSDSVGTLHFLYFAAFENHHVGIFTVYDGSFEKYVQDFTEKIGPLFDLLFKYVSGPTTPVAKNAQEFLQWTAENNRPALGFYSAYPGLAVQDIRALRADSKTRTDKAVA
jgi:hypothetical protein